MSDVDGTSKSTKYLEKIYLWILAKCDSPFAPYLLGILSFTESCVFILPPELLLLPMSYANRKKAFYYALITTVTSVLGAIMGYVIGLYLWEQFHQVAFDFIPGFKKHFDYVTQLYQKDAIFYLFLAAFTPIPFKVFTVAAGVSSISFPLLVITSTVGRGLRYFLMSGLIYFLGERAKEIIEKHFKMFTIVVGLVAILGFIALKLLRH